MDAAAEKSQMTVEDIAIGSFVLQRMVIFFEEIMNFFAVLLKKNLTGRSHLHIAEG